MDFKVNDRTVNSRLKRPVGFFLDQGGGGYKDFKDIQYPKMCDLQLLVKVKKTKKKQIDYNHKQIEICKSSSLFN